MRNIKKYDEFLKLNEEWMPHEPYFWSDGNVIGELTNVGEGYILKCIWGSSYFRTVEEELVQILKEFTKKDLPRISDFNNPNHTVKTCYQYFLKGRNEIKILGISVAVSKSYIEYGIFNPDIAYNEINNIIKIGKKIYPEDKKSTVTSEDPYGEETWDGDDILVDVLSNHPVYGYSKSDFYIYLFQNPIIITKAKIDNLPSIKQRDQISIKMDPIEHQPSKFKIGDNVYSKEKKSFGTIIEKENYGGVKLPKWQYAVEWDNNLKGKYELWEKGYKTNRTYDYVREYDLVDSKTMPRQLDLGF